MILKKLRRKFARLPHTSPLELHTGDCVKVNWSKSWSTLLQVERSSCWQQLLLKAVLIYREQNTIFIDEADHYGLADLHQLRGRVGRSHHRAYCYLIVKESTRLTSTAARRLRAIQEFSSTGAGFFFSHERPRDSRRWQSARHSTERTHSSSRLRTLLPTP